MFRTEKKCNNAKLKFGISTAEVLVGTSLEFIDVYYHMAPSADDGEGAAN